MQTNLETKGISKRGADTLINSTTSFGKPEEIVKGSSRTEGDQYDIDGTKAQKGGTEVGSLVNHLNTQFDLSTGGGKIDTIERNKELGYVIPGLNSYGVNNIYSDANDIKVDCSANVNDGQVIIY